MVSKKMQKHPEDTKKWHRPKIRTIILISVGCLLVYMIINPTIKQLTLQAQLNLESSEARKIALSESKHSSRLTKLKQLLQFQTSPTYSAAYDLCYTWHRDGGWIAYTYIYSCQISYVDFFEVPEEDRALLSSLSVRSVNASVFFDDYLKRIGAANPESLIGYFYVVSTSAIRDAQALSSSSVLTKNIVGYSTNNAYKNRRPIAESGQRELKSRTTYIVLTDEDNYYTKDIGCARYMGLCVSPLGDE